MDDIDRRIEELEKELRIKTVAKKVKEKKNEPVEEEKKKPTFMKWEKKPKSNIKEAPPAVEVATTVPYVPVKEPEKKHTTYDSLSEANKRKLMMVLKWENSFSTPVLMLTMLICTVLIFYFITVLFSMVIFQVVLFLYTAYMVIKLFGLVLQKKKERKIIFGIEDTVNEHFFGIKKKETNVSIIEMLEYFKKKQAPEGKNVVNDRKI